MDVDLSFQLDVTVENFVLEKLQQNLKLSLNLSGISEFKDYFKYVVQNAEVLLKDKQNLLMIEEPKDFHGLDLVNDGDGIEKMDIDQDKTAPVGKRKSEYWGFAVKCVKL